MYYHGYDLGSMQEIFHYLFFFFFSPRIFIIYGEISYFHQWKDLLKEYRKVFQGRGDLGRNNVQKIDGHLLLIRWALIMTGTCKFSGHTYVLANQAVAFPHDVVHRPCRKVRQ